MTDFWCITPYFNPARYKSLFENWKTFSSELKKQKINLLTVELSFDGVFDIPTSENVLQLTSNSVMWQKERLVNYGLSSLPKTCTMFAWLDCDILFDQKDWVNQAVSKLKDNDIIQLFKRVYYLPKGHKKYNNSHEAMVQGVIWQNKTHKNWLNRRKEKDLPFSSPGFGWAARVDSFPDGLYDSNIVGSGDTFIVDCLLGSWEVHGFAQKFTQGMKFHMMDWRRKQKYFKYDFIPQSIYHLYHGSLKNRSYMDRHNILKENDFDPEVDIIIKNGVFEWNSDKPNLHNGCRQYFFERKEDD